MTAVAAPDTLAIYNTCENTLAAVVAGLASTPAGTPAATLVSINRPAFDACCDGFAYVAFMRAFPAWDFPLADQRMGNCHSRIAVEVEVGVIRCAPGLSDDQTSPWPSLGAVNDSSVQVMADAQAMMLALLVFLNDPPIDGDALLGSATAYGPEGGCVGTTVTVTFDLSAACWPPP